MNLLLKAVIKAMMVIELSIGDVFDANYLLEVKPETSGDFDKHHDNMAQILLMEIGHKISFDNSIIRNHVGMKNDFLQDTIGIDFTNYPGIVNNIIK
jgi:hypothetical protein